MSATFSRTLRSLRSAGRLESRAFVLASFMLALLWVGWFAGSRLAIYEISDSARLEVADAVVPVQSDMSGLVVRRLLQAGDEVRRGDVVLELDAEIDRRTLAEEQSRAAGLRSQLSVLERQLASEETAFRQAQATLEVALVEARQRHDLARIQAAFAREEVERLEKVRRSGSASELELLRVRGAAAAAEKSEEIAAVTVQRVEREQAERLEKQRALCESLRKDQARLAAELQQAEAAIARLELTVERRVVRAPSDGRIGELADLSPGAYVRPGDVIGRIIPRGGLRVVAHFPPAAALGRISPGQPARVRLHGFPWGQYGSLPATVTSVADEPRDGDVRVECRLESERETPIPVRHGLPGSVEIEVERVSPIEMVLRIAGRTPARRAMLGSGNL